MSDDITKGWSGLPDDGRVAVSDDGMQSHVYEPSEDRIRGCRLCRMTVGAEIHRTQDTSSTVELAQLRAMRAGLARLHEDAKRWLTESDDRPNLRAAERRIAKLLGVSE